VNLKSEGQVQKGRCAIVVLCGLQAMPGENLQLSVTGNTHTLQPTAAISLTGYAMGTLGQWYAAKEMTKLLMNP